MSMCNFSRSKSYYVILTVFLLTFLFPLISKAGLNELHFPMQKKTIVLDPGHGGYDKGAQGPDGTLEKTVTLEFARVLATELEKKYKVILTRTGDYRLDIPIRTSTANHLKADMFISIHTGGSFLHQPAGFSIYYYKETSNPSLMLGNDPAERFKNTDTETSWSNTQNKHQKNSKILAGLMLNRIKEQIDEQAKLKTETQGIPLMVLEGADMPAVLIEIGYITNPIEEKSFHNITVLTNIARGIRNGIDDFFETDR